jgi:hypothetical protein
MSVGSLTRCSCKLGTFGAEDQACFLIQPRCGTSAEVAGHPQRSARPATLACTPSNCGDGALMPHLYLRLPAWPPLPSSAAIPSCAAAACAASVSSEAPTSSSMTSPPPPSCDAAESAMAAGAEVAAATAAASAPASAPLAESGIGSPAVGGASVLLLSAAASAAPESPASSPHPSSSLQSPIPGRCISIVLQKLRWWTAAPHATFHSPHSAAFVAWHVVRMQTHTASTPGAVGQRGSAGAGVAGGGAGCLADAAACSPRKPHTRISAVVLQRAHPGCRQGT